MITVEKLSPRDAAARRLIAALDDYQRTLYPAESNHLDSVAALDQNNVCFVGAFEDGLLRGCGAVKVMPGGYGEIKRVFVSPDARGRGLGNRIMQALEQALVDCGVFIARLETGIHQPEAVALYRRHGYEEIGPFGEYGPDPLSIFMEKKLGQA